VRLGLDNLGGDSSCSSLSGGLGVRVAVRPAIMHKRFRRHVATLGTARCNNEGYSIPWTYSHQPLYDFNDSTVRLETAASYSTVRLQTGAPSSTL
jgi:hypothetical protein